MEARCKRALDVKTCGNNHFFPLIDMWISFVRHELNPSTARIPLTSFPVMTSTQFPLNQKQIGNTQLFSCHTNFSNGTCLYPFLAKAWKFVLTYGSTNITMEVTQLQPKLTKSDTMVCRTIIYFCNYLHILQYH